MKPKQVSRYRIQLRNYYLVFQKQHMGEMNGAISNTQIYGSFAILYKILLSTTLFIFSLIVSEMCPHFAQDPGREKFN